MAYNLDEWKRQLDALGTKVGAANDLVAQYTGASYQVPELARQRMQDIYGGSKDLITQENAAQAELDTTPANYAAEMSRGRYASNPILAGQMAAQREATIQQKLENIRGMRKEREGTISDVITAAGNAFQGKVEAAKASAQGAQNEYNMASDRYNSAYKEEQDRLDREMEQKKFEEQKRQFEAEQARLWASQSSSSADKEAKKYSYKVNSGTDENGNERTGFSFYGENNQPVSIGKYFSGINGGNVDLLQMANLLKTSSNEGDKQIAAEIFVGQQKGEDPESLAQTLAQKYPWLFTGV